MSILDASLDRAPAARPGYARGLLFRFGFLYWMLFCVAVAVGNFDDLGLGIGYLTPLWNAVVRWVGTTILSIPNFDTAANGSGDRTADWIGLLCIAVVAAAGSLVWSIVDRERRNDARLRELLRVVIRYALGFVMLAYGFLKVFGHQFSAPTMSQLVERYGDSSPMGLLWTFMGASPAYVFFSGAAEIVGAVLLFFRRTTTLGALVLAVLLTNVVLLNFCYDVPVKINSTHYLAMCVLLLVPDLRRLVDVLVLHRPTQPSLRTLELPRRWMRIGRRIAKYGGIALITCLFARQQMDAVTPRRVDAWYDGYWNVTSFVRDGVSVPAVVDDATRWQWLVFEYGGDDRNYVGWQEMDGSWGDLYTVAFDDAHGTMRFTPDPEIDPPKHPTGPLTFTFTHHGDDLTLTGTVNGHALDVTLHKVDVSDMLLVSRGFHWINEVPYNR
jgi:uncharacterized membrane protein YphA (DoxX/SURF4 family)